jgi:hypothetical protein
MHFNSIRVIEDPNTLSYSRVITVNHSVHHRFAERLDGIFREINAFPPLDFCANGNMLLEKYLRLVDQFLEHTCKYLAIEVPAHAELITVQYANDFTLRDMLLWFVSSTPIMIKPPCAFAIPQSLSAISAGRGDATFNSTVFVSPPLMRRRSSRSLNLGITVSLASFTIPYWNNCNIYGGILAGFWRDSPPYGGILWRDSLL